MWFLEKLLAQSRCSACLILTHLGALSGVSPCFPYGPLCHLAPLFLSRCHRQTLVEIVFLGAQCEARPCGWAARTQGMAHAVTLLIACWGVCGSREGLAFTLDTEPR